MPFSKVSRATYSRMAVLLVALGFLLLLGLAGMVVVLVEQNAAASARATASLRAQAALHEVLSLLQDAEIGQRGYLLTGEASYLPPYRRAVSALEPALERLADRLGEDQGRPTDLPITRRLTAEKLTELRQTIDLFAAGDREGALALVRTDHGRLLMEDLRRRIGVLNEASSDRLIRAIAAQARSGRTLVLGAGGAAALIVMVALGCFLLLRRYLDALNRAAAQVRAANEGLERRVAERTAALAEANAEVQRFAYIVSHDLRSPLVNIMGFTSELETSLKSLVAPADAGAPAVSRTELEADIAESIGFIRAATGRMERLIGAILRLSREGNRRLEPERLDMAAVMDGIAGTLAHQLSEGGAEITVHRPMPAIVADRLAVEQIFANLLDNAVKYLEPGRPGRIAMRGWTEPGGALASFEVADNGRGIAPEDRERIFELFRRAGAQDRPGEGIGLAHVRALLRRLGGTIAFLPPAEGPGTVFRVTLPSRPIG